MLATHAAECGLSGNALTFCRHGFVLGNKGQPAMVAPTVGAGALGCGARGTDIDGARKTGGRADRPEVATTDDPTDTELRSAEATGVELQAASTAAAVNPIKMTDVRITRTVWADPADHPSLKHSDRIIDISDR